MSLETFVILYSKEATENYQGHVKGFEETFRKGWQWPQME